MAKDVYICLIISCGYLFSHDSFWSVKKDIYGWAVNQWKMKELRQRDNKSEDY